MNARTWFSLVLIAALMVACADDDKRRTNGALCEESGQCTSGLCHSSTCLDPASDDDGDGLINAIEAALGTHAQVADTDGDGLDDGVEVGGATSSETAPDEDGDGTIDALESASLDSDCDGVVDQADSDDGDGLIDLCASDSDGDGVADDEDNCPDVWNPKQKDTDGDGVGDLCPPDQDGDGYSAPEDCNDADPDIHPDQDDLCDPGNALVNNDCDSLVDEDARYENSSVEEPCEGIGACGTGKVECSVDGVPTCSTNANGSDSEANEETCNGLDDDCDGEIDEGVLCNDHNSCTHDTCSLTMGECASTPIEGCCQEDEDCTDSCAPGVCNEQENTCEYDAKALTCDDGLDCTSDTCMDPQANNCEHQVKPDFLQTACKQQCSQDSDCAWSEVWITSECHATTCHKSGGQEGSCDVVNAGLPIEQCTDEDGDGFTIADGDCEPTNGAVYPGALEAKGCDGIDSDCDGLDGPGGQDGESCCTDDSDCADPSIDVCHTIACEQYTCGPPQKLPGCCVDGGDCDDGLGCSQEFCKSNQCISEPIDAACEDNDPCTLDTCSLVQATCVFSDQGNGPSLQGKVTLAGTPEEGYGGTAWNTDGLGPEPLNVGHQLSWMCSPISAFYYLASRDYDGIDPDSPGSAKLFEASAGFLTFTKVLNSQGKSLQDVTFHFGLMSLGGDAEIPSWSHAQYAGAVDELGGDWGFDPDSGMEIRVYGPTNLLDQNPSEDKLDATNFELRLDGELMVRGVMGKVTMLIPYTEADDCMLLPGTNILGNTQTLHPTDEGLTLSPAVAAAAAAFLTDVGEQGFYIEFGATVTSSGYSEVNGRTGSHIALTNPVLRSEVSCGAAGLEPPDTP